jgi:urate oxidase
MIELGPNRYGKAAIRLVRVGRDTTPHRLRDLTVAIALEGDFTAAHVDGDNSLVVATDTMKNTTYALAAEHLTGSIEAFAAVLGRHFLEFEQVDRAIVNIREHAWRAIDVDGTPAPDAFTRTGEGTRVATVAVGHDATVVEAGIEDLIVMKTTRSAFSGFPRDRYTTLAETDDRLMATKVTAMARRTSTSMRRGMRSVARCSKSSPTTIRRASRPRSGSWRRPCSSGTRSSTRCAWCSRTCITGRSTSTGSASTTTGSSTSPRPSRTA